MSTKLSILSNGDVLKHPPDQLRISRSSFASEIKSATLAKVLDIATDLDVAGYLVNVLELNTSSFREKFSPGLIRSVADLTSRLPYPY